MGFFYSVVSWQAMTQFACFTGPKPKFQSLEFVPLLHHHTKDYVGKALTEFEVKNSWVIQSPDSEPIDEMAGEAMIPAQLEGTIVGTNLYQLVSGYIHDCLSITFIYGTYDEKMPVYTDETEFLNVICQSLQRGPFEIYAKYSAS